MVLCCALVFHWMPSKRYKFRFAFRVGIVAEDPVIDECRERAFAVEIHAVVVVGGNDGHEDQ